MVGRWIIRVELDGPPVSDFGFSEAPGLLSQKPQGRICLSQFVVQNQRLVQGRLHGRDQFFQQRFAFSAQQHVGIGQPDIRQGIVRIDVNGLLKVAGSFQQRRPRALDHSLSPQ